MIHRIVQFALKQRFVVLMFTLLIVVAGAVSFKRMPVDAYPDLSPPMVELITQWPGHAAEEVERLTTLPLELAMNGTPNLRVMRSISLYGLSDVILTFEEGTEPYFARNVVFQRIADAQLPSGVTPSMAPLFSPSGLVYRYVIDSPDRSPMELHTFEDWIIERAYRSVPGVADDSGFGGPTMEYHVLLDPARLYNFHQSVANVFNAIQSNNANTGGGFYTQGGQFYYVRGLGLLKSTDDIGEVVVGSNNGVPVRVKDVGTVVIGNAPRLGIFGFQEKTKNNDDAVEGVILMRRGEQTQNVLTGVEQKTAEINRSVLPPDVKVHAYYDRSDLVKITTGTVEHNLLSGMILVFLVLLFFLVSFRAAVIAALTIPLALLFAFIFLHATGEAANLLSIGAIDFGIIIDGTIVMVENIYRELSERHGTDYDLHEVILHAARDVDRPIFYSVAVIIAGYLPIYALTGPSGKALPPDGRHDVVRASRRSRIHANFRTGHRFLLVQTARQRKTKSRLQLDPRSLRRPPHLVPRPSKDHCRRCPSHLRRDVAPHPFDWRRIPSSSRRRRALGSRHNALHHRLRRSREIRAPSPQRAHQISDGHRRRLRTRPPRRRHRRNRFFQLRILCRPQTVRRQIVEFAARFTRKKNSAATSKNSSPPTLASSSISRNPPKTPWTKRSQG